MAAVMSAAALMAPLAVLVSPACKSAKPIVNSAVPLVCTLLEAVDTSGTTQQICASDAEIIAAIDSLLPLFAAKVRAATSVPESASCSKITAADSDGGVRRLCLTNDQLASVILQVKASRQPK
jgi:hypothetical protein